MTFRLASELCYSQARTYHSSILLEMN